MQILRVYTNKMVDQHAHVLDVDWYEAGLLKITDKGERLLLLHGMPGITYHVLDERDKLPIIR